jgi:hypothetical protein
VRGGWYRRRPQVSFTLACVCIFMLAGILTGIVQVSITPDAITTAALGTLAIAVLACLAIYEW